MTVVAGEDVASVSTLKYQGEITMTKNDLYKYFYEQMFETNEWLSGVKTDDGVQAANYVCGMVEFMAYLLDKCED